tara:strand:+ start:1690 stop:2106 length:417 start_codon:yes stop_codon:yes gene_type:complete
MKIDKKLIKELVSSLEENKLTEIEYSEKDIKIKVVRNSTNEINRIQVLENKDEKQIETKIVGTEIKSPIIGTAYLAPEPGGKKFVEVGKKIKKGDTVMIVEAMKTMNHVPSTKDGIIKEIIVEDGQPVEFGQTLVILD